jgi:hypothetical protein
LSNKKMKIVEQKRKRGRPATGRTPIVALRLAADEIKTVDGFAAAWGVDRSKALRILLRGGFAACALDGGKAERAEVKRRKTAAAKAEIVAEALEARSRASALSPARWRFGRPPSPAEVKAAADRAEQRSRGR